MNGTKRPGRFITLEGGEGAGKSTQADLLQSWLSGMGIDVVITREPGGSRNAECLRELLLGGRVAPFGAEAEALIFAVARADHVAETIRPALDRGDWVICDRFIDSTRAYQGTAGVPMQRILELEAIATAETIPDLTIILDLPVEQGLARIGPTKDRFEADTFATHEARRRAFCEIAAAEPKRCAIIDASTAQSQVFERIRTIVLDRIGRDLPPSGGG